MTLKEKFCLSQSRILIAETKIYRNNSIGMELNGTMVNGDLVYMQQTIQLSGYSMFSKFSNITAKSLEVRWVTSKWSAQLSIH